MAILCILVLLAGVLVGIFFGDSSIVAALPDFSNYILYFLVLSAGIGVGCSKGIFTELRNYGVKVLLYPVTIVIASLLGGAVCALLPGSLGIQHSLSVSGGLGWYTLVSPIVTEASGDSAIGAIAFLANLLREVYGFILLPLLCKIFGGGAAVAVGGACAQDTLLPMVVRYGGKEITIPAVVSGILCSFAVTLLVKFIYLF